MIRPHEMHLAKRGFGAEQGQRFGGARGGLGGGVLWRVNTLTAQHRTREDG